MKESQFQTRLVKGLRSVDAQVLNLKPDLVMGRGWPDLYVGHRLWSGWLELKARNTRLSPAQMQRIDLLRQQDVDVRVLRLEGDDIVDFWPGGVGDGWSMFLLLLSEFERSPLALLRVLGQN